MGTWVFCGIVSIITITYFLMIYEDYSDSGD